MVTTPEALKVRLAAVGITHAAVIDEVFDDAKAAALALDVESFWAEVELNDEWRQQLSNGGIPCIDKDTFMTNGLMELWKRRDQFLEPLAEEIRKLFYEAQDKARDPLQVADNLRRLNLEVRCFDAPTASSVGSSESPLDKQLEGVRLVVLDYDLEGTDQLDLQSGTRRSHLIAERLAQRRGDTPFLVLFSSLEGVAALAEEFRQKTGYMRGTFTFVRKQDAVDLEGFCRHLSTSCVWSKDIGHLQHFFLTLRSQLKTVSANVEDKVLHLDAQDYAYLQRVALQEDGAPLGEYMLDLFGAVLSHELRGGAEVQEARHALDQLDFSQQHLPFWGQPSLPIQRIYRAVLTEPGVGKASPHPLAVQGKVKDKGLDYDAPPLLMLGDIFARSGKHPVYVVMNPACDLQYSAANRAPKLDLSVLMIPGTLESLAAPASNPKAGERMRWLEFEGKSWRVFWQPAQVISVRLGQFAKWQLDEGYERIGRLSLPYSLALQQSWAANLTRVGLPVSPPISDACDISLYLPDATSGSWKPLPDPLPQEAIIARHPRDNKEPVSFSLTVIGRDYLFNSLNKVIPSLASLPSRKDGAEKMLKDGAFWWKSVTEYFDLQNNDGTWRCAVKPAGSANPALLFLWNSDPQPSDFISLKNAAIAVVLRPD